MTTSYLPRGLVLGEALEVVEVGSGRSSNAPNTNTDLYEDPSLFFPGAQQFFFRFIVAMDNQRFAQSLETCLCAEIAGRVERAELAFAEVLLGDILHAVTLQLVTAAMLKERSASQ